MLLTKTITKTEEVQVEIETPSYYRTKHPERYHMICDDGSLVYVGGTIILVHEKDYARSAISDAMSGEQITAEEFLTAYEKTLKTFESSMLPNVVNA